MKGFTKGVVWTLGSIFLLVVVLAIIGIVAYSGISDSSKRSQAETTMQSIYLAQQEYKSNNGQYYYNSNTNNIVNNLFDGVDDLSGQEYTFSITGNAGAGTMCIRATRSGSTTLYLNHLKKKTSC